MGWANQLAKLRAKAQTAQAAGYQHDVTDPANSYRKQLEETVYGGAGRALSSGLQGINGWAAGAGPIGDSGAKAAMQARLAGDIYGRANSQVGQGVSQLLGQLIRQRQQYQYQSALQRQQHKMQSTGLGGVLGGVVGGIAGSALGPIGTAIGSKIGGSIGGGGGHMPDGGWV